MEVKNVTTKKQVHQITASHAIQVLKDLLCLSTGTWSYYNKKNPFILALSDKEKDKVLANAEIQEELYKWLSVKGRKENRELILNRKEN